MSGIILRKHLYRLVLWFGLLLAIILQLECYILRLGCKGFANFSMENRGFVLEGSIIEEIKDVELHECYQHCFGNSLCKSVNIESGDYGICQLNNASVYDETDDVSLTENSRWSYRSTNFSDRLVGENCKRFDPCMKNQLCLDTCECPGYECVDCAENDRGLYCNQCTEDKLCYCNGQYSGELCEYVYEHVNFTESCKLYHGSCRWRKSGDFNWKRVKDNEIPAIVAGNYLRIDASFPRRPGEKALLHQNILFKKSDTYCLKFHYYMNGTDVGQLNIYNGTQFLWSLHGNQGNSSHYAEVSIKKKPSFTRSTVTIEGIRGNGYQGDIAIGELQVIPQDCDTKYLHAGTMNAHVLTRDACSSNPCQNSVTCEPSSQSKSGFKCICGTEHIGSRCEYNLAACNRCQDHGVCLDGIDGYLCDASDKDFSWERSCKYAKLTPNDESSTECRNTCRPDALINVHAPLIDSKYNCLCSNSSWKVQSFIENGCAASYKDIQWTASCYGFSKNCSTRCKARGYQSATTCSGKKNCCRTYRFYTESQIDLSIF